MRNRKDAQSDYRAVGVVTAAMPFDSLSISRFVGNELTLMCHHVF